MKHRDLRAIEMQLKNLAIQEGELKREVKKQKEIVCLSDYDRFNMVEFISILEADLIMLNQQKELLNGAAKLEQKNSRKLNG